MDKPAVSRTPETGTPSYSIWQLLGLLAGPLLFLFVYFLVRPGGLPPAATGVLACTAWAAAWWLTGAVPVLVAGLLPLVLFPLLGIARLSEAAAPHASPAVLLMAGGMLIILGLKRWNLDRRIALTIIWLMGARPARLVAGFLVATAVLAIWLPTILTALIMLPVGLAVSAQMEARQTRGHKVIAIGGGPKANVGPALVLSIAYGATFVGIAAKLWLLLTVPAVIFGGLILLNVCPNEAPLTRQELSAMGRLSTPETLVLTAAVLVLAMWVAVPNVDGATIAMAGGLLLFLIPTDLAHNQWLLTSEALQKVPWSLLLLLGAGLSIAGAARSSGLLAWIAASPWAAQIGTAALGLAAIAGVAAPHVPLRQMVRTGIWLCIAGSAVISFYTYLN